MRRLSAKSASGFTLIEMIAVIVIMGVLAAIAAPGWLTFLNSRRVNAARDEVLQAIRQTQRLALSTGQTQRVEFNPAADPPQITLPQGQPQALGEGRLQPGMVQLQVLRGITSQNQNGCTNTNCIEFDNRGNLPENFPADGISIVLSAPAGSVNSKRCINIQSLLGSINTRNGSDCP